MTSEQIDERAVADLERLLEAISAAADSRSRARLVEQLRGMARAFEAEQQLKALARALENAERGRLGAGIPSWRLAPGGNA